VLANQSCFNHFVYADYGGILSMIEAIGDWITSLSAGAMIVSCICALAKGPLKRTVRFAGGMLLVILLISPLKDLDIEDVSFFTQQYRAEYEDFAEKNIYSAAPQIKLIIEGRTETYILQRAESLGIDCEVVVRAKTAEDGYPYPVALEGVYKAGTDNDALAELQRIIESELAIERKDQIWTEG